MKLSHYSAVFAAAENRQHPLLIQPDVMKAPIVALELFRIDLLVFRFTDAPGTKVPGVFCITGFFLNFLPVGKVEFRHRRLKKQDFQGF